MGMLEDIQNDVKKLLDANKKIIKEALDEIKEKKSGGEEKSQEQDKIKQEDQNKTGKEEEEQKESEIQDINL